MIDVLSQVVLRARCGEVVALCVVVRTQGSTPQDTGAAMLVLRDGQTLGTLGGGCVEAEVRTRAQQLMSQRHTRLLRFRLDQDYGWDDGLVCGGTMDISVQVISSSDEAAFAEKVLQDVAADREGVVSIDAMDESNESKHFEIRLPPTPKLVIAGAGHVAHALAGVAAVIDFKVTVIDDRADYLTATRFPQAKCIVGDIETELSRYPIDPFTYVVIVTRGHKHDAQSLGAVVNSPAAYIGLIGSKRKIHKIMTDLREQGVTQERLAKVHAPIGLEIAAVTPAEIAVSIAAELIAIRRGRGDQPAMPMKVPVEKLEQWMKRAISDE